MKICIFTNHFFPEEFKVNDVAFELQKMGHSVTVITAIPDYPHGRFFKGYSLFRRRAEMINGLSVIRLPIIPRGKGSTFRIILNYLSFYISVSIFTFFHAFRNKYDRIFVHLTSPFFVGLAAVHLKKRQKIPLLFWTLDLWPESISSASSIKSPYIIKPINKMVCYVYNNCDKILIGSKGFASSICAKGNYKEKLVYFPNWSEYNSYELNNIANMPLIEPFVSKKEDDFIVLFAGNLGEAQNLDAVIQAAVILKKNKNIKFVFIGDGRKKEYLLNIVKQYNLDNIVYFTGRFPIETMPSFMKESDVLLVSLKDEHCFNLTVPSKVQFYMSQAKPILGMLNGDGADLIHEAHCGLAVKAGDYNALSESIKKLYKMPKEELIKLGKNGKEFYDANFQKSQRMHQLNKLLED